MLTFGESKWYKAWQRKLKWYKWNSVGCELGDLTNWFRYGPHYDPRRCIQSKGWKK